MGKRYGRNQRRRHRQEIELLTASLAMVRNQRSVFLRQLNQSRRETEEALNEPLRRLSAKAMEYIAAEDIVPAIQSIRDKDARDLAQRLDGQTISKITLDRGPRDYDHQTQVIAVVRQEMKFSILVDIEKLSQVA